MFDSHVHFAAEGYVRTGDAALERARAAGVRGALNPAVDLASSRLTLDIYRRHPWVLPCLGIHPWFLGPTREAPVSELRALARCGAYAAVGEVGLDFRAGRGDEERQRAFLDAQARLAAELDLPLVLHLHKAFYEGFAVLNAAGFRGPAVCHGFAGSREMARLALDRGAFLGAGAALLRAGDDRLGEVYRWAPRDRVLVETDAPPPGNRPAAGRRPWELGLVVAALAKTWGVPREAAAEVTAGNAVRLFGVRAAAATGSEPRRC